MEQIKESKEPKYSPKDTSLLPSITSLSSQQSAPVLSSSLSKSFSSPKKSRTSSNISLPDFSLKKYEDFTLELLDHLLDINDFLIYILQELISGKNIYTIKDEKEYQEKLQVIRYGNEKRRNRYVDYDDLFSKPQMVPTYDEVFLGFSTGDDTGEQTIQEKCESIIEENNMLIITIQKNV
jgi:hypothetical protein